MNFFDEIKRKLIHLSSLWMVVALYYLDKSQAIALFGGLFLFFMIGEYFRMTNKTVATLLLKYFHTVMRPHEKVEAFSFRAFTGSFYFLLAVFLSVVLFQRNVAMASITIMILSDTMAALVGKSIGKTKILDKTLEGSIAFFVTSYVVMILLVGDVIPLAGGLIALVVTVVELISKKIHVDDNLSITLSAGVLLSLLNVF